MWGGAQSKDDNIATSHHGEPICKVSSKPIRSKTRTQSSSPLLDGKDADAAQTNKE